VPPVSVGGVHRGLGTEDDRLHQLDDRREEPIAFVLVDGRVAEEGVRVGRLEESLDDGASHHTDWTRSDEGSKGCWKTSMPLRMIFHKPCGAIG
jgi:hypothetical protein